MTRLGLAGVAVFAALSGCSLDTGPPRTTFEPGTPTSNSTSTMSASVDGVPWVANGTSMTPIGSSLVLLLGIQGQSSIGFYVRPNVLGTQTLGGPSPNLQIAVFQLSLGATTKWITGPEHTGTVNLTVNDATRIAGTFQITLKADPPGGAPATRSITGGTFDFRF